MSNSLSVLRAELARWKKAVEGLTPSGSEFVNDPERCAAYIRERCQYPKMLVEARSQLAEAKLLISPFASEYESLSEENRIEGVSPEWDEYMALIRTISEWLKAHPG